MILSGNIDSGTWNNARLYLREGDRGRAEQQIRYGLRHDNPTDQDVADTLAHCEECKDL